MKQISEYSSDTSLFELFTFFYDRIISGEIENFSQLMNHSESFPLDNRTIGVLQKAFHLIKKLHWGIFQDLDPKNYPVLWKSLVLPLRGVSFGGDLKRNMTITDIYVALMDIHGYTSFCQMGRGNLSLLQMLDRILQEDIKSIAKRYGVISKRARGDEIILIGPTAEDVLAVVISVANYFSKKRILKDESLQKHRPGSKIILPDMKISAGIAGGKKFTPLIITKDGDLSGSIINTAARLQSRANQLSPHLTKVLITKQVHTRLKQTQSKHSDLKKWAPFYMDSGTINFKGIQLSLYEVIFSKGERYKAEYQEDISLLLNALSKNQWEHQIMELLLQLLIRTFKSMPSFRMQKALYKHSKPVLITNDQMIARCEKCHSAFTHDEQYSSSIDILTEISLCLEFLPDFDGLIKEYVTAILEKYILLRDMYLIEIDHIIDERLETMISLKDREKIRIMRQNSERFADLKDRARNGNLYKNRKKLWYQLVHTSEDKLKLTLYSGKK